MTPQEQIDKAIEVGKKFLKIPDSIITMFEETYLLIDDTTGHLQQALQTLISTAEEVKALREDFWYHKGGEDDSYGGKTEPISYKEAYEEGIRYDKDMRKMMQEACDKIKKDPNWTYGENAYPSPHERAIVAGCQKAVKELQAENKKLRLALQTIIDNHFECDGGEACDAHNTAKEAICSLQRGRKG